MRGCLGGTIVAILVDAFRPRRVQNVGIPSILVRAGLNGVGNRRDIIQQLVEALVARALLHLLESFGLRLE